jgi:hypothetical protein
MNRLLISFLFVVLFIIKLFPQSTNNLNSEEVVLQFITINGYGNNLYIDNVSIGSQFDNDAAVTSINNIPEGTSYTSSSSPFIIAPEVTVLNAGKNNITTSFNVTMVVTPGGYSSTKIISSLNSGQVSEVIFDDLTITPGTGININVSVLLAGDQNPLNDSLSQYTIYLTGAPRNVLIEQWTSCTCGPCGTANPSIDAFINTKFDSVAAIKYHVGWPAPGNDPMYLYNPTQSYDRRYYYGVNSVPYVIMDGVINIQSNFANELPAAFNTRVNINSPLSITVTDTHLAGDTIQADVTVTVHVPMPAGNYYLRVHAIERKIEYSSPPGTNGETVFYDVFRRAFPNSTGTVIPNNAGTYNFTFKYPVDTAVWVDSMIYTTAFVQNDITKEVINSGKARNYVLDNIIANQNSIDAKNVCVAEENIQGSLQVLYNQGNRLTGVFNAEIFEGFFPPCDWSVINPDGGITFAQFSGASGPSFGGDKSVQMNFYSYTTTNASDTLKSCTYTNLLAADSVKFDYAYAQYPGYSDRLIVRVSIDGGITYPFTIFDKAGAQLATAPSTTSDFIPSADQWATFSYPLETIVPVQLITFNAKVDNNNVYLSWVTANELNNLGFEIQRKETREWERIGFIEGKGTTNQIHNYSYNDNNLKTGKYAYRLKQIDLDGTYKYSNEIEVEVINIESYFLTQNYPNPFNPTTSIVFGVKEKSDVRIVLFNTIGQEIAEIVNEEKEPGQYTLTLNAETLANGVYFYQMQAGEFIATKKMVVLK